MKGTAIVTGASRGLGEETATQLCERGLRVVLAARDGDAIEALATALVERGLEARAVVTDVTKDEDVARLARAVDGEHIEVVVANAGVALDGFDAQVVERTLAVNFDGVVRVVRALLPQLERGARVVVVSSAMGELSGFAPEIRARFDPPPDEAAIRAALDDFRASVAKGAMGKWPRSAYRVSKLAVGAWTRRLADEVRERGVLVNAVCPGWVRTDMGGPSASRTVEEGALGIVWAATLPPDGPTGGFFRDGHAIAW